MPTPTLSLVTPSSAGRAETVDSRADAAVTVRSPPLSSTVPWTAASVSWSMIAIATEPATPMSAAAPALASADTVAVSSAPLTATMAETVSEWACTVTPIGTTASFTTRESVTATPAPIAAEPPVAEPSAELAASAFAAEARVTVPPAWIEDTVGAITVRTVSVEIATPTAAATATEPSEVSALGCVASPESARPRSPATPSA